MISLRCWLERLSYNYSLTIYHIFKKSGITWDNFHKSGYFWTSSDKLNNLVSGAQMALQADLNILLLMPSGPVALFNFSIFEISSASDFVTWICVTSTLERLIWNKGTAFEATLHDNCVNEVYVQLKGDMNCSKLLAFN